MQYFFTVVLPFIAGQISQGMFDQLTAMFGAVENAWTGLLNHVIDKLHSVEVELYKNPHDDLDQWLKDLFGASHDPFYKYLEDQVTKQIVDYANGETITKILENTLPEGGAATTYAVDEEVVIEILIVL